MKLMKRIAAGLAAAAAALTLPFSVSAKMEFTELIENIGVYDVEGVFTEEQAKEAGSIIRQTAEKIDMYIAVVIVGTETNFYSDSDVEDYAKQSYINLFDRADSTQDTDGCLLLLNDSTEYDYLATQGLGQLYYYNGGEEDRVYEMLETITPSLKAGDRLGAIRTFCEQLEYYYNKGMPDGAYTYNSDTGKYLYYSKGELVEADSLPAFFHVKWGKVLGIGGVIGLIAGLITMLIIKSSYKLKKSLEPTAYVSNQETQFQVREDMFLRTHTSKVYLGDSSRSGGGGGGGHSSSFGGHSFGGGGHHR